VAASPDSYGWLADSVLSEAGCITVVPDVVVEAVVRSFGDDIVETSRPIAQSAEDPGRDDVVWTSANGTAAVLVEGNGFQGGRPEVLRPCSKKSGVGKAASLYWNVNGMVVFSAARRGKVVCSVELIGIDEVIDEVPASLRRLARLCEDEGANLVAIGAAMVETFTGVRFGSTVLESARCWSLVPVPEELRSYGVDGTRLRRKAPSLVPLIAGLDRNGQRRLAEWAARAAAIDAGVADDPAVQLMIRHFGSSHAAVVPPSTSALIARWRREMDDWWRVRESHVWRDSPGAIGERYRMQRVTAGDALRYTAHPDSLESALTCVVHALETVANGVTERGLKFVEDATGRHLVDTSTLATEGVVVLSDREARFIDVVERMLATSPDSWDALLSQLPASLSDSERAEALRLDAVRQDRGDFATWQTGGRT